MKKIFQMIVMIVASLGVMSLVSAALVYADPATEIKDGISAIDDRGLDCKDASGNPRKCTFGDQVRTIVNLMLYILGAIAVVMIVIGGIRYTTANGESGNLKAAKDTILYSAVGLVVAIMAFAIVNFVIDAFIPKP